MEVSYFKAVRHIDNVWSQFYLAKRYVMLPPSPSLKYWYHH